MSWSKEAEQSVLGGCMLDELAYEMADSTGLKASDFHSDSHSVIYDAITQLIKKNTPVDVVTVADWLDDRNKLEGVGGAGYLSQVVDWTPSIDNTKAYAEIVFDYSRKRQLKSMACGVGDLIDDGETVDAVQDYVSSELSRISEGRVKNSMVSAGAAMKSLIERLQNRVDGVSADMAYPSGLEQLDGLVRLEGGRLYIIAGRPGMGKSVLSQTIANENAKNGVSSLVFSMELPADECIGRSACQFASIDNGFLADPGNPKYKDEWSKVTVAATNIKDWPLHIDDSASVRVSDVKNKARSFFRKSESYQNEGRGIILIDYLGLMKIENDNRVHGLGEITKELKRLAMELRVPVVLLHQLNRGVDSRQGDKRPNMSDLRDSGEIEEDADCIMFVYRDEKYHEDTDQKGIAEIIIRKNRTGREGTAFVKSQLQYYRFANLAYDYQGD
ncbi:MAG: replicative DNA helicase [Thalassolituus sp.]